MGINYYYIVDRLLMSVKSFEELPFETLFQMAEEKYESLDYEEAEYFYSLAYAKNPNDEVLVLCYANLLKLNQDEKKARQLLEKSIKDMPTGSYKRYMELADIYQGVQSIQTFEKGIANAELCLRNPFKSTAPEGEIKRDIAQAYASIAEVCLTDLLEEKRAESKCVEAMQKGEKIDPTCIDIRVQKSNYLMWKDDFETAKTELLEIHRWIKAEREEYETETITTVGKYLIEVEEYGRSRELFEKIHEDASNEIEVIYMLAYCSFKLNEWAICEEYLEQYDEKADEKKKNGELIDEEIEEAVSEIKAELPKKKKEIADTGEDEQEWMDVQEDEEFA